MIDDRGGSSALYTQLAVLYYAAGDVRKSVLAERSAVSRAEPAQRKLVKARIAAQRKQIDKAEALQRRPAERRAERRRRLSIRPRRAATITRPHGRRTGPASARPCSSIGRAADS